MDAVQNEPLVEPHIFLIEHDARASAESYPDYLLTTRQLFRRLRYICSLGTETHILPDAATWTLDTLWITWCETDAENLNYLIELYKHLGEVVCQRRLPPPWDSVPQTFETPKRGLPSRFTMPTEPPILVPSACALPFGDPRRGWDRAIASYRHSLCLKMTQDCWRDLAREQVEKWSFRERPGWYRPNTTMPPEPVHIPVQKTFKIIRKSKGLTFTR